MTAHTTQETANSKAKLVWFSQLNSWILSEKLYNVDCILTSVPFLYSHSELSSDLIQFTTQLTTAPRKMVFAWLQKLILFYFSSRMNPLCKKRLGELLLDKESLKQLQPADKNRLKLYLLRCHQLKSPNQFLFQIPEESTTLNSVSPLCMDSSQVSSETLAIWLELKVKQIFNQIDLKEFTNSNWIKKDRRNLAPFICKAIDFFNFISFRVSADVILPSNVQQRCTNICRLLEVAQQMRKRNNFELLGAIVAGLNSCAASQCRLQSTWNTLPKRYMELFEELEALVSPLSNYHAYRQASRKLQNENKSYVPLLSVILRDITMLDTTLPDFVNQNQNSPNMEKYLALGNVIAPINQLFDVDPSEYRKSTQTCLSFDLFCSIFSSCGYLRESELLKLSYQREPPANPGLLEDSEETSSHTSNATTLEHLTMENRTTILRKLQTISPEEWNSTEVYIILEVWGWPEDSARQLVNSVVPDGYSLLHFRDPDKLRQVMPLLGKRKLFMRQVKALRVQWILNWRDANKHKSNDSGSSVKAAVSWISSIYPQYELVFEQHKIDMMKLKQMSNQDLLKIGITPLGHRKTILRHSRGL